MKPRIEGSFVALVTPFNEDGSVDFGAMRTLVDWHARHGTSSLLFMGTTGEASMLVPEERARIVVETARWKTGALRFFYGCAENNTARTIDNVRFAAAHGADGAMLALPPYVCATADEGERYFLEIADATDLPLGIYNNAGRLRTDLHWDQLLRLFRHPRYVVHKESSSRVDQIAQLLRAMPDVSITCDDSPAPGAVVQTMSLGGHGLSNGAGNIAPEELALLSTPWRTAEQPARFREAYFRLLPLLSFTYSRTSPVPIKSLMKAVGLPAGHLRRPLTPLEPQHLAAGVQIIRELGLGDKYGFDLPAIG